VVCVGVLCLCDEVVCELCWFGMWILFESCCVGIIVGCEGFIVRECEIVVLVVEGCMNK